MINIIDSQLTNIKKAQTSINDVILSANNASVLDSSELKSETKVSLNRNVDAEQI